MPKSDNKAREQHILDAAADLFTHYGYDKTPVSDIAREAGVSQGTIYLHFSSKDELFEKLLVREMMTFAETWLEHLEADPKGGTIGGMYTSMLYALSNSPFMSAILRRDGRVLGNYMRKPDNFYRKLRASQSQSARYEFVKMMQDAGAVRRELDPKVVAHIMNILAFGLVGLDDVIDQEDIPPLEDTIAGIADMMDRALTPDDGGNQDVGKAIVRQIFEASRQQYEQWSSSEQEQTR